MARAMDVANCVIDICNRVIKCGAPNNKYRYFISNLYLQKLLYFLNVIYLLKKQRPLIEGEHFETWDYGPVLFDVYETYKTYGGSHITRILPPLNYAKDTKGNNDTKYKYTEDSTNDIRPFIKKGLEKLLYFSPSFLINKSHEESQWQHRTFRGQLYNDDASRIYYKDNQFWRANRK